MYLLSATESLLAEFNLESILSFVRVLLGAFGLVCFEKSCQKQSRFIWCKSQKKELGYFEIFIAGYFHRLN